MFVNQSGANVTVAQVRFLNQSVVGGNGGNYVGTYYVAGGGGGGLAFNGAMADGASGGGGGGGVLGASTYLPVNGGANGGAGGGGGGAKYYVTGGGVVGSGGVGYAGNAAGSSPAAAQAGGAGGFGGGGGGGSYSYGGLGGFGGGGGGMGPGTGAAGNGGPGGGGGAPGQGVGPAGSGGSLGAGVQGGRGGNTGANGGGGGGAAAGPAVFVNAGTLVFTGSAASGLSATGGLGAGSSTGNNGLPGTASAAAVFNYAGQVNGSTTVGPYAMPDVQLGLTVTSLGGTGNFTFSGNNGWVNQTISTATPGVAVVGPAQGLSSGSSVTLNLVSPSGVIISAASCTGMGSGTVSRSSSSITLDAAAMTAGNAVSCSLTLTQLPQLGISFTIPSSATATLGLDPDATNGNGWPAGAVNFTPGGATSQSLPASPLAAVSQATRLNQKTPVPSTYSMGSVTCTDANYAVSGNPSGSFTLSTPVAGSFQIAAANVLVGAQINCVVPYLLPASAAQSTLTVAPAGPLVAGAASYTVTASARDANGALVTTSAYTYNFSTSGGSLSAASCTTATSGGSAGSIGATPVGGDTNPVTGVFVAGSATAGSSIVAISTGPKLANGTDLYTITATALDVQGNVSGVTGTTFNFSAPTAGASLSAGECMTATTGPSAGTCSVTLSATVAGSYSVTATVGGSNVGGTNPVTGVFVAGAATASSSRVAISQGPKTANGVDAYTITASALDANGNLNTSAASTFSFSAPGTGAALSAATCATATSGAGAGTCSVLLTATTAGSYSVIATVGATLVGGTNPVVGTFVAGAVTADTARLSLSAGPRLANGVEAYTLTASALDAQGNLNTSSAISFNFSDPGAGAHLSAASCNTVLTGATAGTCSVTLTATTAGSYSVTATVGGANVGGTNPVTAVFVASGMDAGQSRVSITLTSATKMANGRDVYTITATAYDNNGNLNTWQPQTFEFSWREGGLTRTLGNRALKQSVAAKSGSQWTALSSATCTTATSGAQAGSCSVTLNSTLAGWFTVLTSAGGVPVGSPSGGAVAAQFVAGPAVAANSVITISPGTKQADGVDTHTVTITARDAFDNVQADVSTLFTFSPPAAGATLSPTNCSTATTGANAGSCSVTLKATTPGNYTVAGSLGGQPAGSPVQGQFVAPAAGAVTAVPTLGEWGCVALVLCLGLLGAACGGLKRRSARQPARPGCARCSWPGTWPDRHGG